MKLNLDNLLGRIVHEKSLKRLLNSSRTALEYFNQFLNSEDFFLNCSSSFRQRYFLITRE